MGEHPRYGVDISMPLPDPIPIDVYAEVAFRDASDFTRYTVTGNFDPSMPLMANVTASTPTGITAQVSGGLSTTIPYNDKNTLQLGLEYFYNPMGVDKPITRCCSSPTSTPRSMRRSTMQGCSRGAAGPAEPDVGDAEPHRADEHHRPTALVRSTRSSGC